MKKITVVLIGIVACGLWLGGAGTAGDGARMPGDQAVPGWAKSGAQRVFTAADLYGYIDGGAELFLEFGFEALTLQHYKRGADEIGVEIYRMKDLGAGLGIYLMKGGRDTTTRTLAVPHTADRYQIMALRGRYLLLVNRVAGGDDLAGALEAFAARVVRAIPAEPPRPLLRPLPAAGQVPDSARLIRGPYALGSLYTLGEGDILSLQVHRVTALAARYRGASGETALVLADYPTPEAAGKAFRHVADNLDPYIKVEQKGPAGLVFKDYAGKYGSVALKGRRITLRLLLPSKPPLP